MVKTALGLFILIILLFLWEGWESPFSKKEVESDPLERLKDEFGEPEVLARNKNKKQMIELSKKYRIKVDYSDSKLDIARKIFDS